MQANQKYENSIFWIDTEKISPNPYQPRREFDEERLRDLAESIRQYGILQPLTVSRIEIEKGDGGISVGYELIAGERRLRASKIAGLPQVPCIIRVGDDSKAKLELAIIENLQREDLNPVDRAKSFQRLAEEFSLKHQDIGKKISKSREYVSNTMRLLSLPQDVLTALEQGRISEGHTRPLLMLATRPEEQLTLFKEMLLRKMTVREAEGIARRIAYDKVRKKERFFDPDIADMEGRLAESLGTRVHIEKKDMGGKILIDFFSYEELQNILRMLEREQFEKSKVLTSIQAEPVAPYIAPVIASEQSKISEVVTPLTAAASIAATILPAAVAEHSLAEYNEQLPNVAEPMLLAEYQENLPAQYKSELPSTDMPDMQVLNVFAPEERMADILDDRTKQEVKDAEEDDDIYNIKNFSL
jgi:ParB family transcriptional regulator, chromosome partitioning protein